MSEDFTEKQRQSDTQRILTAIEDLHQNVTRIDSRLGSLEGKVDGLEKGIKLFMRDLSRGQSVLNDSVLKVHVGLRDIDERLSALEGTHNQPNCQT